ncbi:hypothetical protein CSW64_02420 [Caulobacter mirabilis]|uniref:Uncharacterized protein n=2 Tax=Caulobacter mirabilis TaxID=69666 RepID=A0A2D2ATQ0_9CAUL|nr:hypothetical protein CSW64_02420 [Caulobacter mirabilis]
MGDDYDRILSAVQSHRATVAVPADRANNPDAILGAVFSEDIFQPIKSRAGHQRDADLKLSRLFGHFIAPAFQRRFLAPKILASEAIYKALENTPQHGGYEQVFASAPSAAVRGSLTAAGFWLMEQEKPQVSLRLEPHHFASFVQTRNEHRDACEIAVLEEEGLLWAAQALAALAGPGVRLPGGEVVRHPDAANGRNAVYQLALEIAYDVPGAREQAGLQVYRRDAA